MATVMTGSSSAAPVRCSLCGANLEHARMDEHVCHNTEALHMPEPSRPVIDRLNSLSPSTLSPRNAPLPGRLPKFAPPARIDPFAANEAFLPPPQTAPGFHSEFGAGSPARAGSPASSRFRMPPRSATTPHFRERSRSPEMRMPQDSAFPLFPTKRVRNEQAKKDRQRSKSVSRSQSRDRGAYRPGNTAANSSGSRAGSPALPQFPLRPSTSGGSASRKNSVSSNLSRGDQITYPNSAEPVPPLPAQHDTTGRASPHLDGYGGCSGEQGVQSLSPLSGPPIMSQSENSVEMERRASDQMAHFKQPSPSAAIQPLDAIGSTKRLNHDLALSIPRSQSVNSHRTNPHSRDAPPVPEVQSAIVDRRPSDWTTGPSIPDALAIRSPPSKARAGSQDSSESNEDALGNLPSFKTQDNAATGFSTRSRTSTSSDGSSYSATHSISSRSSPPTSASSFTMHDNAPKTDNIDHVIGDIINDMKPPLSAEPTLPVLTPAPASAADSTSSPAPVPAPLQQRRRGPAKSFSRPNYARPQLDLPPQAHVTLPQTSPRAGPGNPVPWNAPPGDTRPINNQAQMLVGEMRSPVGDLRSPPSTSPMSPAERPFSPMSPKTPQTPGSVRIGEHAFHPPRRPTTPGFKGNCRGCGEMIVGKSVSSADGRLTGRYHKQCFVCQTCKEPFQTADFYVINNQPYCQRHYHTLNGSLCSNCDRGIEGPYMETDAKKKFHPHCFTCKECHLILRNDYFEVNGVIYCEKHSRKPDLLGPGRRFPERRTTRLMMM